MTLRIKNFRFLGCWAGFWGVLFASNPLLVWRHYFRFCETQKLPEAKKYFIIRKTRNLQSAGVEGVLYSVGGKATGRASMKSSCFLTCEVRDQGLF